MLGHFWPASVFACHLKRVWLEGRLCPAFNCIWIASPKPSELEHLFSTPLPPPPHTRAILSASAHDAYYVFSLLDKTVHCGAVLNELNGWITSEDRDNDGEYDHNLDCLWTIFAAPNNVLLIRIINVDIEWTLHCEYDYLKVLMSRDM